MAAEPWDIVIAGGGAAGCVLAERLSADPAVRVLLLEAGPADRNPMIHLPKGVGKILANPRFTWRFPVRQRADANTPPGVWLRGKTLGGSSSTNGMMYVRGQPADFDALAEVTSADWSWSAIGPTYAAIERHALGSGQTRGAKGALGVSLPPKGNRALEALIEAAAALGLAVANDVNAPQDVERIGWCPQTIWRGRRQSAAVAFLRRARKRRNLTIRTGVTVDRIVFDGTRATGLVVAADGIAETIPARRIILSAGTFGSPAILQRSGVGDPALLGRLGIPVVAARPEVGANLREHCGLTLQWRLASGTSTNPQYRGWRLGLNAIRYALTRTGPLATATFEVGGWFKVDPSAARPDAQLLAAPHSLDRSSPTMATERFPGMQMVVYPLRPRATGHVQITATDPDALPESVLDFFPDAEDRADLVGTVRFVRRLIATAPMDALVVEETRPGPGVESDDEILEAYRAIGIPAYHAAGTCRMGNDAASVVDPMTRVRGVEGVHVVDLSIAPQIPSGNTFAPVLALAWRAAKLIRRG